MDYRCDRCGAVLKGGATACAACGRQFDVPVPSNQNAPEGSTESGMDALLRGRTAARTDMPQPGQPPGVSPSSAPPPYYGTPPPRSNRRVGLGIGIALTAVLILGGAGWGGTVLWLRGPSGEKAYRQHNLAGNAASERGDFRRADDEYGQMIALRPRRVDGYLLRGINELQEGLPAESIADDTAALGLTQEPMMRGDLLSNRADGYLKQGNLRRAIADDTAAIQEYARVRDPRLLPDVPDRVADNYRHRAEAYWQRKDYKHAIADCTVVLASSPHRPDDFGIRAKAETVLGQDAAAQADFNRALRLDPTDADCYIGLGNIAEKHHQFAQAVAVYQRATQTNPGNAQFRGSLGWFQYEAGLYRPAIASDTLAQSLDPNQEWVNYNLALCYAVAGDGSRAKAAYADVLAHGTPADQQAGLADIRTALAGQPGSAVLRAVLQQVTLGDTGAAHASRPRPTPSAPPRSPSPLAAFLGPEVRLGGYAIQPPAGYTQTQRAEVFLTGAGTAYLWSGSRRSDGTVPTVQVEIIQDDGSLATRRTSAQETHLEQRDLGNNHSHMILSPVTSCTIGGTAFARGDWQGVGQQTGRTYSGSEYYSVAPYRMLHLSSHDAQPYARTTQPLLLASLQTFRRL